MSHSPDQDEEASREYIEGWGALYELVREGRSWSGHERHNVFFNTGGERFADISAVAGLDFVDDGRGLAVVDWDQDGALDLWTTNRTSPRVRLLRNRNAGELDSVAIRLEGRIANRDAIGARVSLQLAGESERHLVRSVQAGDAFLSQSSKWLHFGLGEGARIGAAVVSWPGGALEEFGGLEAGGRFVLVEGTGAAVASPAAERQVTLAASVLDAAPDSGAGRTVLAERLPLDGLDLGVDAGPHPISPLLVNLWASWCPNCRAELGDLAASGDELRATGLRIAALSVDEAADRPKADTFLAGLEWSFDAGFASSELVDVLGSVQQTVLSQSGEMVLPTSFLLDSELRLAVIYRGPLNVETLLSDTRSLAATGDEILREALPFPGRWIRRAVSRDFETLGNLLRSRGHFELAWRLLADLELAESAPSGARIRRAETFEAIGHDLRLRERLDDALEAFQKASRLAPDQARLHVAIARTEMALGRAPEATVSTAKALELEPSNASARVDLGLALAKSGKVEAAVDEFARALELSSPGEEAYYLALYNLGVAAGEAGRRDDAKEYVRRALEQAPEYFDALQYLAVLHQREGEFGEAIALYERALEVESTDPRTLYYLGRAYLSNGDRDSAMRQSERLEELGRPIGEQLRREIEESLP